VRLFDEPTWDNLTARLNNVVHFLFSRGKYYSLSGQRPALVGNSSHLGAGILRYLHPGITMQLQFHSLLTGHSQGEGAVPIVIGGGQPLQKLGEVRRRQGLSLRAVSQRLGRTAADVRKQEDESADLLLSELYQWQNALDVPVEELLLEPKAALSPRIHVRAKLLKIMKTARSLSRDAESEEVQRLASLLVDQLVETMPELKDIAPWPAVGHRRSPDELGRIGENPISDNWIGEAM
jgi:transcriptional regulator with XRE-family HTH domain